MFFIDQKVFFVHLKINFVLTHMAHFFLHAQIKAGKMFKKYLKIYKWQRKHVFIDY